MQPGERVEVYSVWAGGLEPLSCWSRGFEFVEQDGPYCVVRHLEGLYAGLDATVPQANVRLAATAASTAERSSASA
jgi:hypothetical protein